MAGRRSGRPNGSPRDTQKDDERKLRALTQAHASKVPSIGDAVVTKDGDPFFICPRNGQIPLNGNHGFGLYHHDMRYLAGLTLKVLGAELESLGTTAAAGTTAILELTNPELPLPNGRTVGKNVLTARWTRSLDGDRALLHDRFQIENHGSDDATLEIRVDIAAGFRDVYEIRGLAEPPNGRRHRPTWDENRLVAAYDGGDGVHRTLSATFDPAPSSRDRKGAVVTLVAPGRGAATLELRFEIEEAVKPGAPPMEPTSPAATQGRDASPTGGGAHEHGASRRRTRTSPWPTSMRSDSRLLDGVIHRSLADLAILRSDLDGHCYYGAGLPWFSTLFGRDALIAAYQTLAWEPSVAASTLRLLAGRQGTDVDTWRDEQPGKILHELRVGELARLGRIPQTPYYGSVDATSLFLILLGEHATWTGSLDVFRDLRGNVDRALDWLDGFGDGDEDGLIEYASHRDGGLANQGWKDSGDAIVDAAGHIARPPIRLAEVQGYAFAARHAMADLFERDGQAGRAADLRARADQVRSRFERAFWSEDLGCYVMALQDRHAPCAVVSSNAGQVLFSGIASKARAARVEHRLMADDMWSGWGIRTLSTEAVAYNPVAYHLGTVWPHDNSLIAAGFRRYGFDDSAEQILEALVEAAGAFDHRRLPECFSGIARSLFEIPVKYPIACHPQAWAAGSVPYLLGVTLGLRPDGFARRLRIVRPRLPSFVNRLELRGLPVAGARVDLAFRREGDATDFTVEGVEGDLEVVVGEGHPDPGDGG